MQEQRHLYIQSALLYSTAEGERRIRVHNAAIPLTNIPYLPFDYLDTSALALYLARSAVNRLALNQSNFASVQSQVELILTVMNRAQARFASSNPDNYNVPGELPE